VTEDGRDSAVVITVGVPTAAETPTLSALTTTTDRAGRAGVYAPEWSSAGDGRLIRANNPMASKQAPQADMIAAKSQGGPTSAIAIATPEARTEALRNDEALLREFE